MNIYEDFKGYFESAAPGSVTPFAAGRLVMSKPEATYEGPDGTVTFGPDSDLEELYAIPSIKALWNSIYGKPFAMALVITGENKTEPIEGTPHVRLICPENVRWMHVDYWQAINLAARITAKRYPQSDDRKDAKLCIVKGNPAPGKPPAEAHSDSGEQFDGGYYCKGDSLLNYTQYAVYDQMQLQMLKNGSNLAIGSDADGDMYYRASSALARLAKGTANYKLFMNAGATAPEWADGFTMTSFIRDMTAASGDVNCAVATFVPRVLITIGASNGTMFSVGFSFGTVSYVTYASSASEFSAAGSIFIIANESAGVSQSAVVKTIGATTVLTWTKTGSPAAGNFYFAIMAFR